MVDQGSNVVLSPFAKEVVGLIRRHTTLAETILVTQCRLTGCRVETLAPEDLDLLILPLREAVKRFTSPLKGDQVEAELRAMQGKRARRFTAQAPMRPVSSSRRTAVNPAPGSLSYKVLAVLGEHTAFGEQIFIAQCKSVGAKPDNINLRELERLIPLLSARVGQWTSPITGRKVETQLRWLHTTEGGVLR